MPKRDTEAARATALGNAEHLLRQLERRLEGAPHRERNEWARCSRRIAALEVAAGLAAPLELQHERVPKSLLPRCGARTRAGHPCRAPAWRARDEPSPRNGRCRMHGGLSTGPRTAEGKARCAEAARRNLELAWAARRATTTAP